MIERDFLKAVLVKGLEKLIRTPILDDILVSQSYQRVKRVLNRMEIVGENRKNRVWNSRDIKGVIDDYGFKIGEIVFLIAKRSVELVYNQLLKGDTIENSSIVIAIEYAIKIIELEERTGTAQHTDPILEALKSSK
jgi:hypothetical protein